MNTKNSRSSVVVKEKNTVFFVFCLWSFILLCRPQDFLTTVGAFRPGLITTALMLAVAVICSKEIQGPPFFQEKQVRYYSALCLMMVVGIPTSLHVRVSFNAVFTEYIIVILYFFIFYKVVDTVSKLSVTLLLGCLGSGGYFVSSLLSGSLDSGRLSYGTMFDPNDIAFFALSLMPFSLLFILRKNNLLIRVACLGTFAAGTLLILLSGSRGGVLGYIMFLLVFLFKTNAIKNSMKICTIICCMILLAVAPINFERYSTILDLKDDYNMHSEGGRLEIWKIGGRALLDNPLTGVGVGCFQIAVGHDRLFREAETLAWQTAHNSIVQIGTEAGIFGLALFLLLSLNVLRIFNRVKAQSQQDELVKISEMGFAGFVGMFTSAFFLSQAYSMYWCFYVVFSAVVSQIFLRELTDSKDMDLKHE